ncbi:hypothetical protein ANN_09395 [Periplaneta americana]|uniref:Uncharacterized protein n=1 Tax=Periplaneta americana TaxID=6978 RepID=A0ABQ8TLJ3_PERAM|nr:hypothetical protein ANN_09395 [Periplaneta americana]
MAGLLSACLDHRSLEEGHEDSEEDRDGQGLSYVRIYGPMVFRGSDSSETLSEIDSEEEYPVNICDEDENEAGNPNISQDYKSQQCPGNQEEKSVRLMGVITEIRHQKSVQISTSNESKDHRRVIEESTDSETEIENNNDDDDDDDDDDDESEEPEDQCIMRDEVDWG